MDSSSSAVRVHPAVEAALADGRAVVALETAAVTAGLPREPFDGDRSWLPAAWRADEPVNLEVARAMVRAVESSGATAAVIAVQDGALRIGLDEDALERLARDPGAGKASAGNLASMLESGGSAGTTVSATLAACGLARPRPIRMFATGGIGGVHRGWAKRLDVSADLRALATSPVCVVCAGAKSMLDVEATVEALEALGVLLLGWQTAEVPRFIAAGGVASDMVERCDDAAAIARRCARHWFDLGMTSAALVGRPARPSLAIDADELDAAAEQAERAAAEAGVGGAARTPFVLARMAELTAGRSLAANIAVLLDNAELAGRVAVAFARGGERQ